MSIIRAKHNSHVADLVKAEQKPFAVVVFFLIFGGGEREVKPSLHARCYSIPKHEAQDL